jgi:hypothetical protein
MRNFGIIPRETGRSVVGGLDQPSGLHISAGAHAESNSLAGDPPRRLNLAVVRGSPFTMERELNPIEPLDPRLDHREVAICVCVSIFITIVFGLPIAVAAAIMSWS